MVAYNLTGKTFGKLKALKISKESTKRRKWVCVCDCGRGVSVATDKLISGHTKSCGCLMVGTPIHKMAHTRFYRIWLGVKKRCDNDTIGAKYYRDAGITYSDRWKAFENFYEDMHKDYEDSKTLDRIDPYGNYCKENCRWATYYEQALNKKPLVRSNTGVLNVATRMNKGVESLVARFTKEGKRYVKTYSLRKYSKEEAMYLCRKYLAEMYIDNNYCDYDAYNNFVEEFVKDYGILSLFCKE